MDKVKIYLPNGVKYIIDTLENAGFEAFVVGGAVRDFLLGKQAFDFDITTSATAREIKEVFKNEKTVDTGIKHGTVTVVLDGAPYEVTTYRIDGEYRDSRHPEKVSFTKDLSLDLCRRDFTVNAMAYNEKMGLVDLFSGKCDLEKKLIRTVGVAEKRFGEDALRILRALRFASKLGFSIESETSQAIFKLKDSLLNISKERLYSELMKLLEGQAAYGVLKEYGSVISVFLPGINTEALPEMARFDKLTAIQRLAALFLGKEPSVAEAALSDLKADNKTKFGVKLLLECAEKDFCAKPEIKRLLMKIGEENTRFAFDFKKQTARGSVNEGELENILNGGECFSLATLAVNGSELMKLGIQGKAVGQTLTRLLDAVIDGEVENEKNALLAFACQAFSNSIK